MISTTSLEGLVDATDHLGQLAANDVQVSQTTVHRMVRRNNQTRLAAAEPFCDCGGTSPMRARAVC